MTRRLAREEGLLVGGSCGMAAAAALRRRRAVRPADDVVVVLLPDGGRGYLSKIFNDRWMASYGFLRADGRPPSATSCAARAASCRRWCTPTRRDRAGRRRDPARVRRVADAGGPGRAAGHVRARWRVRCPNATCSTPCSPVARAGRPGRQAHGAGPAAGRLRRAARRGPARARERRRRDGRRRRQARRGAHPRTTCSASSRADAVASRHLDVHIDRTPADVYDYVCDPRNLPSWAAGLGSTVEQVDGRGTSRRPAGEPRWPSRRATTSASWTTS